MISVVSQLAEISRLYHEEGLTVRHIADRLGITTQSIYYHASTGALVLENRKRTLDRDELVRLRVDEQLSAAKIAKLLNTHSTLVYEELKRFGITGQRLWRRPGAIDLDELHRLYVDEGLPIREVAERMKVCARKVRAELGRAGIKARRYTRQTKSRHVPHIKLGEQLQSSGLPESAERYNIQVESKVIGGIDKFVIGMSEISRLFHDENLTVRQIGRLLGFSANSVYSHVHRGNLVLQPPANRVSHWRKTLDEAVLRDLYLDQRMPMKAIAARLGTTPTVVAREVDRLGIREPRHRAAGRRTPIDGEKVRDLYSEKGRSMQEVAIELNTNIAAVRNEMLRLSIDRRAKGAMRGYDRVATLQVGEHFIIEVEAWRKRPSSGLSKAARRHGVKVKAERAGETTFRILRVA